MYLELGTDRANGHGSDGASSRSAVSYAPVPREQMGLLTSQERAASLAFDIVPEIGRAVEARDMSGKIRQGEFVRVNLAELNTLTQQRQVYEGIDTLSENIREVGLIHPLLVSRYTREGARAYLAAVNNSIGRRIPPDERKRLEDLKVSVDDGQEVYDIVVSGHRRLRALHMLQATDIVLQVIKNIDPYVALKMQASENTPKLPRDWERAMGHGDLYAVEAAFNPKLTPRQFARSVGVTEDDLRRDLRFYSLPDKVKEYVIPRLIVDEGSGNSDVPDQPFMVFKVACQLGRLVEAGASEHDILLLARNLFIDNIKEEKEASRRVSNYIRDSIQHKSDNLFDIFGISLDRLIRGRRAREAAQKYVPLFKGATAYLRRVKMAEEQGLPDEGEEAVSFAGAAIHIAEMALAIEELLPGLRAKFADPEECARVKGVFQEVRQLAEEVIDVVGVENLAEPNLLGKASLTEGPLGNHNGNGNGNGHEGAHLAGLEVVLFSAKEGSPSRK